MTDEKDTQETEDESLEGVFEEESEDNSEEEKSEEETKVAETKEKSEEETSETTSEKEPTLVPIAALHDERRKAQSLKEENEKLRSQLPQDEEKPDPIDDPEGYEKFIEARVEKKFQAKADTDYNERVEESRSKMLETHDDYVDKEKYFMYMVTQDDSLNKEMSASSDPAKFAYDTAKAAIDELQGNTESEDDLDDNSEDEEPSESEKRKSKAVKSPSLATASAKTKNTVEVEKDDESVEDICKDMTY